MRKYLLLLLLISLISLIGCSETRENLLGENREFIETNEIDKDDENGENENNYNPITDNICSALVINGLAETVSSIDLNSYSVSNNLFTTGTYPNDIKIDSENEIAYIINSGNNNLQIVDLTNYTSQYVDFGTGTNPWAIAFDEQNRAYITALFTNEVIVISLSTLSEITRIPVGTAPAGICYINNRIYVANTGYAYPDYYDGSISVISTNFLSVLDTITVAKNPQFILANNQNEIEIICTGDYGATENGSLYILNTTTNTITHNFDLGGTPDRATRTDEGKTFICGYTGGLMLYDAINHQVLNNSSNPVYDASGILGIAYDNINNILCLSMFNNDKMRLLDADNYDLLSEVIVGDGPQMIDIYQQGLCVE